MTIIEQFYKIMITSIVLVSILLFLIFSLFNNPSNTTLSNTNLVMAIIHLIVTLLMFRLSVENEKGWDIFYESEIIEEGDVPGDTPQQQLENIRKRIFVKTKKKTKITSLFRLCALFSFLTAIAHIGLVLFPTNYYSLIENKQNPIRWLEYFVTSGIMMTCIASVSDVRTEYAILATFSLTALTNIFGMAIEATDSIPYKWFFMGIGFIPYIIPWYMIVSNYSRYSSTFNDFKAIVEKHKSIEMANGEVLTIAELEERLESLNKLKYIILLIAILYNLFPAIQMMQIVFPNKYRLGEMCFILASLVSKVSLNTGIFFLGNRPATTAEYVDDTPNDINDDAIDDAVSDVE